MSVEWWVPLTGEAFLAGALVSKAAAVLGTMLLAGDVELVVRPRVHGLQDSLAAPADGSSLAQVCIGTHPGFLVSPANMDDYVEVSFMRSEGPDDEFGAEDWLIVHAGGFRSNVAYAIGIGVAIAAAMLAKSQVVDEAELAGHGRLLSPEDFLRAVANGQPYGSIADASAALIARTCLSPVS